MPINIGVEGGTSRKEALQNIRSVDSEKALDTLQQIRTQLSRPGRDSGVLTLHNRTNSGEMKLERKNGFQLLFQDDKRLDDTVVAMKSLLNKAGQRGALQALDHYLVFGKGDGNKIESSKMLEILNRYLPQGGQEQDLVETGKAPEILEQGGDPKLVDQDGEQNRLEPRKMLETVRPVLPPPGSTKEEVYLSSGLEKLQKLKSGMFGTTSLVRYGGEELILKEMKDIKPVHRDRSLIGDNNEAMAAFLSTGDNAVILETVNITQPISFLISMKNEGKDEFRLVNAHTLRSLLKFESQKESPSEVLCHGLVMPIAKGEQVTELFKKGLDEPQQKDFCRSTLHSIKGLNERGFVHRDIKPDNAFFDPENGTTTLIDTGTLFKESKHQGREDRPQYIEGWGVGTVKYLHPRGRAGEAHGTETDLFALAVMTMEMAHPRALKDFGDLLVRYRDRPPQGEVNNMTWMRGTLDKQIEALKVEEANAKSEDDKTGLKEMREGLEALRRDMDDPNTPTNFAVKCFDKTLVSSEEWHDRTKSQAMYSELQQHPFIKQQPV